MITIAVRKLNYQKESRPQLKRPQHQAQLVWEDPPEKNFPPHSSWATDRIGMTLIDNPYRWARVFQSRSYRDMMLFIASLRRTPIVLQADGKITAVYRQIHGLWTVWAQFERR